MKTFTTALTLSLAGMAGIAQADTALGLTGDRTLVMIDTATGAVSGTIAITGTDQPVRDLTILPAM